MPFSYYISNLFDVVSPDSFRGHADKSAVPNLSTSTDLTVLTN
jgi:hypothetical protein